MAAIFGAALAGLLAGVPAVAADRLVPTAPQARTHDAVVEDLKSTDPDVRVAALRALSAGGYPESLGPLATLLTDPLDEIQFETLDVVLGFFLAERPPTKRRVAGIFEVREATSGAEAAYNAGPFVLLPRPVPPALLAGLAGAMRDQNPAVRLEATYTLGVVARPPLDPVAADVLQGGLRDSVKAMRVAAARVLGGLRVASAGDALVAAVNDPEPEVKQAAMRALGDIGERRAVGALIDQFNYYKTGSIAEAALDGLARIGDPTSVTLLREQLVSRRARHRRWALEGLARANALDGAVAVKARLDAEKDPQAKLAAAFAVHHAGDAGGVRALLDALGQKGLEAQAMAYLVELGPSIVVPLGGFLANSDPTVREHAAMVLGLIGGAEAIAELERARTDPNREVVRAVERAIARAHLLRGRPQ